MADKILAGIEAGGLGPITLAGTLEAGDLVGDSTGWKAAKQAATAIPARGVIDRAGVSGDIVQLHTRGLVRGASGLTAKAPVYLAEDGEVSSTPGANFVQMVGFAVSTTEWVIDIDSSNPSAHIADASVAHALNATFSDTEVEAALDALGGKINSILAALEAHGIVVKA